MVIDVHHESTEDILPENIGDEYAHCTEPLPLIVPAINTKVARIQNLRWAGQVIAVMFVYWK